MVVIVAVDACLVVIIGVVYCVLFVVYCLLCIVHCLLCINRWHGHGRTLIVGKDV